MTKNADTPVWDGMRFRELACRMSHLQEPYGVHVQRMSCDGQWADASVIHALACSFKVDVGIWQSQSDPMLICHSLLSNGPSAGLLPIALQNDHHFWGVVEADVDTVPTADKPTEIEDWMRLPLVCTDENRSHDIDSDDDDGFALVPAALDIAPVVMTAEEVDAELNLCNCLATWSPWDIPTADVSNSLVNIRSPTTARRCLVREQVVADLIWEASNADSLPNRMKYNAASRYRLQTGRFNDTANSTKLMYSVATDALSTQSLIALETVKADDALRTEGPSPYMHGYLQS